MSAEQSLPELPVASSLSAVVDGTPLNAADGRRWGGISVTDPAYGATDDGQSGYFFASWVVGEPGLTIYSSNVAVTVVNIGPNGVAVVTIPGATSGNAATPQHSWTNKPIAIDGAGAAGGVFVSRVFRVYYDYANAFTVSLQLTSAAPTPLVAAVQRLACPCFTSGSDGSGLPSVVGKKLWIGSGGSVGNLSQLAGGGNPLLFTPFTGTVGGYVSPFEISMTAIPGVTQAATAGTYLEWGTDNTVAVVQAGCAALAMGQNMLLFPGFTDPASSGRFCLFDYETNTGPPTMTDRINGTVTTALHWVTSNASVFVTSMTGGSGNQNDGGFQGNQIYKAAIPWNAAGSPAPRVSIDASTQWPRLATLSTIVVLIVGDSWAAGNPSGQGNPVWGPFITTLLRRNAGKTIHVVNHGVSGSNWNGLSRVIADSATVTVAGLGAVTPDLVCLFVTGGNDGTAISRNDIMSCINTVKSWPTKNGLAPDICLLTGTFPRSMEKFWVADDNHTIPHEYAAVLHRSVARTGNYAIVDVAGHGGFALRGWSEDQLATKQVPPVAGGVAGPVVAYVVPYQCRDFFMAIRLGTGTGADFWATAGTLSVSLSPKPDNRLVLSVDASGALTVMAVTWGMAVATTCSIANGSASLSTSGQIALPANGAKPAPFAPSYIIATSDFYMKDMIGQCYFAGESYYGDQDYRTYIVGYTNASIVFGTDGNPDGVTSAAQFYGGQMFIASDATARVDCIVQNAGTTSHPLTGANSLVTTVAAYSSFQAVTLAAPNSQADISSAPQKIFVGSISVKPTYNRAVAAGLDAGLLPVVTIRKSATHVRVGYVPGGLGLTDIRATVQSHEQLVWEGEVELFGGPFIPKIYTGETSTVQVPMLQIDDREGSLRRPTMTMREAFGGLDPTLGANPFGGDSGHPSQLYLANVVDEVASAQNLAIPHHYHNTFGVSAPETGFCFTVPDHQVFTALTPSGTLATGTVTLPAVFSQGGRLELFSTQSITALTVTAPAGLGLAGLPATTIAANATIAYRLIDTTFCRVL